MGIDHHLSCLLHMVVFSVELPKFFNIYVPGIVLGKQRLKKLTSTMHKNLSNILKPENNPNVCNTWYTFIEGHHREIKINELHVTTMQW